eukprot:CAMPEP_0174254078 /NCGR_PEP_ID=MMETSP0439-20130205/3418_1 /TAXON_ID=0 /ORGANISM="Stereomyxa ramosa, Strain Chinc5" /LENGTH=774 /DNA_ID=CAMNT_0015335459 /DNA_START=66 /DNA_END=2387 /DNA_ORIENTATION=+
MDGFGDPDILQQIVHGDVLSPDVSLVREVESPKPGDFRFLQRSPSPPHNTTHAPSLESPHATWTHPHSTATTASNSVDSKKNIPQSQFSDNCYISSGSYSQFQNPTKEKSPKRKRVMKSPEQVAILEHEFSLSPLPNKDNRFRISKKVGLTPRQVQIWFQNKRAKVKNTVKKHNPSFSFQNPNYNQIMEQIREAQGKGNGRQSTQPAYRHGGMSGRVDAQHSINGYPYRHPNAHQPAVLKQQELMSGFSIVEARKDNDQKNRKRARYEEPPPVVSPIGQQLQNQKTPCYDDPPPIFSPIARKPPLYEEPIAPAVPSPNVASPLVHMSQPEPLAVKTFGDTIDSVKYKVQKLCNDTRKAVYNRRFEGEDENWAEIFPSITSKLLAEVSEMTERLLPYFDRADYFARIQGNTNDPTQSVPPELWEVPFFLVWAFTDQFVKSFAEDDFEIVVESRTQIERAIFGLWMNLFSKFLRHMPLHHQILWIERGTSLDFYGHLNFRDPEHRKIELAKRFNNYRKTYSLQAYNTLILRCCSEDERKQVREKVLAITDPENWFEQRVLILLHDQLYDEVIMEIEKVPPSAFLRKYVIGPSSFSRGLLCNVHPDYVFSRAKKELVFHLEDVMKRMIERFITGSEILNRLYYSSYCDPSTEDHTPYICELNRSFMEETLRLSHHYHFQASVKMSSEDLKSQVRSRDFGWLEDGRPSVDYFSGIQGWLNCGKAALDTKEGENAQVAFLNFCNELEIHLKNLIQRTNYGNLLEICVEVVSGETFTNHW